MKSILFFDPTTRIKVHSATSAEDVDRTMNSQKAKL